MTNPNKSNEQAMREAFDKANNLTGHPSSFSWLDWQIAWKAAKASLATPQPQSVWYFTDTLTMNLLNADETGNLTATGGQESEAQADILDDEEFYNICQVYRWAKDNGDASQAFESLKCFIRRMAPPSAIAIETAAKLQAAEVCKKFIGCEYMELADDIHDDIIATIPQDGITELEKLMMQAVEEAFKLGAAVTASGNASVYDLRAIVKSLIGERNANKTA